MKNSKPAAKHGKRLGLQKSTEKVDETAETPLVTNKPFKMRGKRLDLNPVIDEESELNVPNRSVKKPEKVKQVKTEPVRNVLAFFLLYRLINCYVVRTWFAPDEYWQSQEVAHHLAFKYGYLTWEWKVGIRSYIYPAVLSVGYKALEVLNLDETFLLNLLSPLLHSLLAAFADFAFYIYVKSAYNGSIAYTATLCRLLSWYTFYTSPRSLSNNLEEMLTIFILASKTRNKSTSSNYAFHALSFLSFSIRATAAINLIPIYVYFFFNTKLKAKFVREFIVTGFIVMSLNTLLDSYLHGKFLLSSYNFFLYNVYQNIGTHYGTHVWYWYFISGFPTILFTHLIPLLIGIICIDTLLPLLTISFNIFVYSLLSHKEFRFLSQIMPFSMILCAFGFKYVKENFGARVHRFLFTFVASTNIILALVLSIVHQRAPLSLMDHLKNNANLSKNDSIVFLTPCHSTPYYSYLHKNISMKFLTCEPNLSQTENYIDEADSFFANPYYWLYENEKLVLNDSSYIILFENLYNELATSGNGIAVKIMNRFYACNRFFYSFTKQTQNTDKKLLLLCLRKQQQKRNNKPKSAEL